MKNIDLSTDKKDNIFGERFKALRTAMNKTQKEFSEFLGIPQPTLSAYESGRNKPTIDVVIAIANKCNVSVDWLCGRDDTAYLQALPDLLRFFFELYESKEFCCKTEIHDRVDIEDGTETNDEDRNWIKLTFYHNEQKKNPQYIYSQDICSIIKRAYELNEDLKHYNLSQEMYESEKEKWINIYKENSLPITKEDFSNLSAEERRQKQLEYLKAQLEKK